MASYKPYNNGELISMMAAGDEHAFREIYNRYAPKVYTLALSYLKSPCTALDIVQEVFLKIWLKRKELPLIENFDGWIRVVSRNQLISVIRKKLPEDESLVNDVPGADTPEEAYQHKQTESVIREAIEKLSPRQRQVYLMAREEGLQRSEIAHRLNVSRETVKEHMSQALKNIRSYLLKNLGIVLLFLIFK